MRVFYEREKGVPAEPTEAIAAAKRCSRQRERIRCVQREMEFCEAVMEEMELLPEREKRILREAYTEILNAERAEYERRRAVLLDLGYDDYA